MQLKHICISREGLDYLFDHIGWQKKKITGDYLVRNICFEL